MLSWKNALPAAALLLLLNACGSPSGEPSTPVGPTPTVAPQSTATNNVELPQTAAPGTDPQAGYVRVDGADGQSVVACSYSINGKKFEGKSQEECDRLKKDFEKEAAAAGVPVPPSAPAPASPAAGQTQVACAFNINGKLYEGKSQAECDKLKKDLGITISVPSLPVPAQVPLPAPATSTAASDVACAFNINGKLYEGKTQTECDKLKKDLGLQF